MLMIQWSIFKPDISLKKSRAAQGSYELFKHWIQSYKERDKL
jgi:hypothetical protein